MRDITVRVNGRAVTASVEPRLTLADFIRERAMLTGTHLGCEHGVCGACTVLLDGVSTRSCLTLAVQADGHEVTTVEALAVGGELHPLQRAFKAHHGLQCGFCTPGFLMALAELWPHRAVVSWDEVEEMVSGQLCRCTGYAGILAATRAAFGSSVGAAEERTGEG
jgi:carbon-monoxide dehydrogenase small subunit